MHLNSLLSLYQKKHSGVKTLAGWLATGKRNPIYCPGLHESAIAMTLGATAITCQRRLCYLIIMDDEEDAGYLFHDLEKTEVNCDIAFFPSGYKRAAKYGRHDAAAEILRADTLERLCNWKNNQRPLLIVTYPAALAESVPSADGFNLNLLTITEGSNEGLEEVSHKLFELGFVRKDYVYEPGEFAIRGSILDVFSWGSEYPFRIDYFGDDVESIRTFEVQSQLSKERCKEISIAGCPTQQDLKDMESLLSHLPNDTYIITRNTSYVYESIKKIVDDGICRQALIEREETEQVTEELARFVNVEKIRTEFSKHAWILLSSSNETNNKNELEFNVRPQPIFHKNFDLLEKEFSELSLQGYNIYVMADSEKQLERLRSIIKEEHHTDFHDIHHTLHAGFIDDHLKACFFTDHQIFDRFHKYNLHSQHARNAKMALTLKELLQFTPGDYIVHTDHGIGRFAGLVRMPSSDGRTMQEMIKIVYQGDDVVFVSIHSLYKVSKYKGREGSEPKMSKLGSGAWEKLKERAKEKIKDIARDLILIYSKRKEEEGFAFSPDSFLQRELEAGFAYEDTPDQLRVTQEVKADMESSRPMDRLVCGDVGFGKTEIAIRAALKAAADGKQVAVLVPTTVLALQHFKTFSARLKDFPINIDYISRARSASELRSIKERLASGILNIVIGTHKLTAENIKFHDLGLLIIDEEQKFGVAVKERLRKLKTNVDTLTLSATPIPRTLQFSLMGARDFSVIQTPPPNRCPIRTELHTFGHEVITEAVNFEMSRGGQVFVVSPRVSALPALASLIQRHVPDARIVIGHGQMPPTELEKTILDFSAHEYDVLVSTTIIENGIDIPNANTIIVDSAHHFGLSDLHQMRGRVGRSDRKAFCYLLAPPLSVLPADARRRLQAIESYSDLGSGIHIAMQDLDIRGAGNLLGAEQSGFIANLGYETYQKILAEAVNELRANEFSHLQLPSTPSAHEAYYVSDCSIETDKEAFFPETYVPGAPERMMLYRELDNLTSVDSLERFRNHMIDRFGKLPIEAEELLAIVPLRQAAKQLGCERLTLKSNKLTLHFITQTDNPFYSSVEFGQLITYAANHPRECALREDKGRRRMNIQNIQSVRQALDTLHYILGEK